MDIAVWKPESPGVLPPGQLRTLQRRVKQWRSEIAHRLVLGLESGSALEHEIYTGAAVRSEGVRP